MDPKIIISEIEAYARASGLKPTTICQRSLGNARLYERLQKRIEDDASVADRLRAWMEANPVQSNTSKLTGTAQ